MDPKWTLSLLAFIHHTVASAPESGFALEGNSVTLIMQRHNNMDIDDVVWVFNQSWDVVRYYPHHNKRRQVRILDSYKGRVEFDSTTFSLELTNLRKNDSGLYKGQINADGMKAVSEYRLNVFGQVAAPVLTVEPVSSSGDLCNVTVTCRAGDLSLTSTCDISTCTQEEQTAPSSLAIFIKDDIIICNHSNPVSWHNATVELEMLCQKPEFPLGDEQTPIWIYITVASGLLLLVLVLVLVGRVLFFQRYSTNQADSSSNDDQSVGTPSPYSAVKQQTPSKYGTLSSSSNLSQTPSPSDVKRRTPFKSSSPYPVGVNLLQTPSPSSAVKQQTPSKYGTPSSSSNLSQTPCPSSGVKWQTPKSRTPSSYSMTPCPSSDVKWQTPSTNLTPSTYLTPSSNTVANLLQTPSSPAVMKKRTPFKSRLRSSKAVVNLEQKFYSGPNTDFETERPEHV